MITKGIHGGLGPLLTISLLENLMVHPIKEIKQNGVSICNPQELAIAFNNHFPTVGPKLANEIPLNNNGRTHLHYVSNPSPDSTNFEFMPTNRSKVLSFLSKLRKSKATGLDKISAKLLRICADLIADSL